MANLTLSRMAKHHDYIMECKHGHRCHTMHDVIQFLNEFILCPFYKAVVETFAGKNRQKSPTMQVERKAIALLQHKLSF